jgi:hypothetical protein
MRIPTSETLISTGWPQKAHRPVVISFLKGCGFLFTMPPYFVCENQGSGCRPPAVIFDTRKQVRMRWPPDDEIRWIEWRLRELEGGEPCTAPLTALDCRIWLAYKRDKKSYADIARAEYPHHWDASEGKRGNQKILSLVRRTVGRVERYLTYPNGKPRKSGGGNLAQVTLSGLGMPLFIEYKASPPSVGPQKAPSDSKRPTD